MWEADPEMAGSLRKASQPCGRENKRQLQAAPREPAVKCHLYESRHRPYVRWRDQGPLDRLKEGLGPAQGPSTQHSRSVRLHRANLDPRLECRGQRGEGP